MFSNKKLILEYEKPIEIPILIIKIIKNIINLEFPNNPYISLRLSEIHAIKKPNIINDILPDIIGPINCVESDITIIVNYIFLWTRYL